MSNVNLPPIGLYVRNCFMFEDKTDIGHTWGHLISARSLQNQSLQFSVLLETGALFTGLPAHALCFQKTAVPMALQQCQMWDNISSNIQCITLETLKYMPCNVKLENGEIKTGIYHFTIDYCGHNDLSRDPIHWKQSHCIQLNDGNFVVYPQYRIQFQDKALCHKANEELPKYTYNDTIWVGGS